MSVIRAWSLLVLVLVYVIDLTFAAPGPASGVFFEEKVPEVVSARLGGRVVLTCEAGGSPSPTLHWLYNGERILQSENVRMEDDESFFENHAENKPTLRIGSTKSRLFLDCVTEKNTGEYACVADEPTRRIAKLTQVEVDSSFNSEDILLPTCLDKRQSHEGSPARVYMWTAHRLEVEGADVQLFCRAEGSPTPAVSWVRVMPDEHVTPLTTDQYEVLPNGDLFIHQINFLDNMGIYRCVAENSQGKDEVDTFLYPTALRR